MRYLVVRIALLGSFIVAVAGCGSGGDSLAVGASPNGSGGGAPNVTNQPLSTLAVPGVTIDDGNLARGAYTGFNATATDAQSALESGPDAQTTTSGPPPADPAPGSVPGSHLITFAGNGQPVIELAYGGRLPNLAYATGAPGAILPATYGAIVFFAAITNAATPPAPPSSNPNAPSALAVEITGGTGTTAFDVRIPCAVTPNANSSGPPAPFARYTCPLPAYGAIVAQPTVAPVTAIPVTGTFTPIVAPVTTSPPTNPKYLLNLYVVLQYPQATTTASTGNTLLLDGVYAEAGKS